MSTNDYHPLFQLYTSDNLNLQIDPSDGTLFSDLSPTVRGKDVRKLQFAKQMAFILKQDGDESHK